MNFENIIPTSCEHKTEPITYKKSFPHIVSKESFERLIMSAESNGHLRRDSPPNRRIESSPPKLSTSVDTSVKDHDHPPVIMKPHFSTDGSFPSYVKHDSPPQKFQQTSVITSIPTRKKSDQRRSIHRQRNVDESVIVDSTRADDKKIDDDHIQRDNYDGNGAHDESNTAEKCDERMYHPYSMIPYTSYDAHENPKSRSMEGYPSLPKSKSLDMPDKDQHTSSSLPHSYFTKHGSFNYDEETARKYFQSLYITTSPSFTHGNIYAPPRDSLSRDSSFSDSPTSTMNNSPMGSLQSSPMRRLQEGEYSQTIANTMYPGMNQPLHPIHVSRSYEKAQNLQHKYSQRKAYSLNTAPYDFVHREKNLRRIFSEEIVPENPLLHSETRAVVRQHMRRAASYDLSSYVRHRKSNHMEKLSGSVGNFHQQISGKPTSKIIFPEHDNVKDYKSIFVKPIDDEASHAMDVMEKSSLFNTNGLEFVNYFTNSIKNYPFLDDSKKRKTIDQTPKPKLKNTQQSSQDNAVIGPYQYDPTVDDVLAVCVTGLLTLPGSNEKRYPITVGELRRRIAPPEFLNKVDMISYVRLAKTSARELLEKHVIRPKHHSRKSKHSIISKMCEAECSELANGMNALAEAYFPKDWLAKHAVSQYESQAEGDEKQHAVLTEQRSKIENAQSVLHDLSKMLESSKTNNNMQNYNLATHSYGLQNLANNIELITSILDAQTAEINRTMTPDIRQPSHQTSELVTNQMSIDCDVTMETDTAPDKTKNESK